MRPGSAEVLLEWLTLIISSGAPMETSGVRYTLSNTEERGPAHLAVLTSRQVLRSDTPLCASDVRCVIRKTPGDALLERACRRSCLCKRVLSLRGDAARTLIEGLLLDRLCSTHTPVVPSPCICSSPAGCLYFDTQHMTPARPSSTPLLCTACVRYDPSKPAARLRGDGNEPTGTLD